MYESLVWWKRGELELMGARAGTFLWGLYVKTESGSKTTVCLLTRLVVKSDSGFKALPYLPSWPRFR